MAAIAYAQPVAQATKWQKTQAGEIAAKVLFVAIEKGLLSTSPTWTQLGLRPSKLLETLLELVKPGYSDQLVAVIDEVLAQHLEELRTANSGLTRKDIARIRFCIFDDATEVERSS